jgi:predicted PurR-regulated permease PerM
MNDDFKPRWLDRLARLSWRYLLVLAAIYVTFVALGIVKVVVIPVILALFPASVLSPLVGRLKARGWSPLRATWTSILVVIPVLAIILGIAVPSIAGSTQQLGDDLGAATDSLTEWLSSGPLHLSQTDIQNYIDSARQSIQDNASTITSGVLGGATVAIEVITGIVLMILALFFFLKDGDRAVEGVLARTGNDARTRKAFEAAWGTLSSYVRGLVIVGTVDAIFIGIGLAIVGTPLVAALMILVFVGAFFPVIGAFLSGLVAVAVTLVNGGFGDALIILAIVIGVQQLEGHILYPIVFRRALALHPLVILLALSIGGVAFGIVGAFLAVPFAAVAVAVHQATSEDPDRTYVALLTDRPYGRSTPTEGSDEAGNDDEATSTST